MKNLFNEKTKVPQTLKEKHRQRMEEFFASLKAKGLFESYESYSAWEQDKYKKKEKTP